MTGLTTAVANRKLKEFGKNVLNAKKSHPWWKMLFEQFTDVLVLILVAAAGISFFVGETVDAGVIFFIVLLNAGIGFVQEFRTEKTLEALKNMIHPEIRVLRDGKEVLIETALLVPGDIVILGEGDKIPADGILTEGHSFRVDEAILTGESVPVGKEEADEIFMGTSVVHGSGMMEVGGTGMGTKFGQIARLTTETEKVRSPLQKELAHIGIFVTKVTGIICVGLFFIGMWRDFSMLESLLFSVSVAIAAVPEGLPTTVTIALALGASVLARKKAVMKKLSSVETLGAVTTICSDKTGTLTRNEMTVREVYLADRSIFEVSGVGYDPSNGDVRYKGGSDGGGAKEKLLENLLQVCEECNEATLEKKNKTWHILGDPTEGALLTLALKHSGRDAFSATMKLDEIFPFDSDRKMMSVISKGKVLVKGSPDQLLDQCDFWSDGKKTHTLTKEKRQKIEEHYKRMAEGALRVLAFASREVGKGEKVATEKEAEKGLVFLGLVGMIDPPRKEVYLAVKKCQTAGIRSIVITGDYGLTAEAIARELCIVRGKNVKVLTGEEVKKMSDSALLKLLKKKDQEVIFARSLPEQKMRIVQLLQSQGEIVAMTGDGVNDAPALKKADIGVAMGITGTEVSKEAATMVLTNDSFASIVTAVEEGRRIYENLRKFIWFIFSCNIGELFVIFMAIIFNLPLPLTAILILCIDLGTDILPAIALGVDDAEKDLMSHKPRNAKERVMNKNFVQYFLLTGTTIGLCVMGAFLWTLMGDGWTFGWGTGASEDFVHAQSVAFTTLVFVQLVNAFSARSEKVSIFSQNPFQNKFLIIAIMTSILMVLLMLYVPFLNTVLGTQSLSVSDWGVVAIGSLIPLGVIEMRKRVVRSR